MNFRSFTYGIETPYYSVSERALKVGAGEYENPMINLFVALGKFSRPGRTQGCRDSNSIWGVQEEGVEGRKPVDCRPRQQAAELLWHSHSKPHW